MWNIKGRINWHEKEKYLKKIRERKWISKSDKEAIKKRYECYEKYLGLSKDIEFCEAITESIED